MTVKVLGIAGLGFLAGGVIGSGATGLLLVLGILAAFGSFSWAMVYSAELLHTMRQAYEKGRTDARSIVVECSLCDTEFVIPFDVDVDDEDRIVILPDLADMVAHKWQHMPE